MGDDISSGSVTDCLLRSFSDLKGQTQQCRAALRQKSKQTKPEPMSLITQLTKYDKFFENVPLWKTCCPFRRWWKLKQTLRTVETSSQLIIILFNLPWFEFGLADSQIIKHEYKKYLSLTNVR